MLYFLAGIAALLIAIWALNRFKTASPATLARVFRLGAGSVVLAAAVVLGVRGAIAYAMPLAMFGIWLLSGPGGASWGPLPGSWPSSGQASGQSSRIVTDHLEMELDHDTGAMRGRVLKGVFAGRPIERLAPAELALLWRDCQFDDPRSARLIEAWLDRTHPTWREDMARAEGEPGAGGIMTRKEASEILGVPPGASPDDIRRAHRELMKRMHPDAGGSSYLATKINEAKDVLLGK